MKEDRKITIEKLEVYMFFNGDIDDFARRANKDQQEEIFSDEWYMIDELINDYHIIKKELAAKQFEISFHNKMDSNFHNEEAKQKFYQVYDQIRHS